MKRAGLSRSFLLVALQKTPDLSGTSILTAELYNFNEILNEKRDADKELF